MIVGRSCSADGDNYLKVYFTRRKENLLRTGPAQQYDSNQMFINTSVNMDHAIQEGPEENVREQTANKAVSDEHTFVTKVEGGLCC